MFGPELDKANITILHTAPDSQKPFLVYVGKCIPDLHFVGAAAGTTCLPLYRYDKEGERHDNITDWGLRQFQSHCSDPAITKHDIFHYTYAVLHQPGYRSKYEINLNRESPRLPFYEDFRKWVEWGRALMELHLGYEQALPFPLERHDRKQPAGRQPDLLPDKRVRSARLLDEKLNLKPRLRAVKGTSTIEIDATTSLDGVPLRRGTTSSATSADWNGCSTSGRNTKSATQPWRRSSTPIASPITRSP
jgi:hypothetical protein